MMRYRFTPEDSERLGIPHDWVEFDASRLMFDEAVALEESGYDVDEFLEDLRGVPVVRRGKSEPVLRQPMRALGAQLWIAARRAGCKLPFSEFTFDLTATEMEAVPQGKGDSPDPTDPNSTSET